MISLQTTMPSRDELLLRSSPPKKRLVLGGMSLPTAAAVLRFLYTGEAQLVPENVLEVHLASERLGISALRQLAEHMLPRIVNEENVCSILRDAFALRLSGLMAFASAYALRHFDAILDASAPSATSSTSYPTLHAMLTAASSSGFYSLSRPIVAGLLSSDDLCVASEEKVFRFAVFWGIANVPTNARVYSGEEYNPANASKISQGAQQQQSIQAPMRTSVASAAAGITGTSISSSTSSAPQVTTTPLSSQSIATQLFPQIPVALVPALRASLTDIFSSIRFQLLETDVLRSPLCAALVSSELLLNAMFEKTVGPSRRDVVDGASGVIPSSSSSSSSAPSFYSSSSSFTDSSSRANNGGSYQNAINKAAENPRILSLGSLLLLEEDAGAGASAILTARTALSATSGYLSISSPRRNNPSSSGIAGAMPTYPSSSSSSYYTDRDVYKSVDLEVASALAAEVGGTYDSSSERGEGGGNSSSSSASTPWESQNVKSLLLQSSSNTSSRNYSLPHRRFSQLDPSIAKDVSLLRFDAFAQGKVNIGNLGRTASFTAQSSPAVVSSLPTSALQIALAASSSSAEGSRGATLLSMIPCVSVRSNSSTSASQPLLAAEKQENSTYNINNLDPVLPSGPVYSFEFVVEDSEALHDVDPEKNEQVKTKAATLGSTIFTPFELALCLLPNGAALSSLVAGLKSPDPAAYGAVWCLTNRGDLYVSKQAATATANTSITSTPQAPSSSSSTDEGAGAVLPPPPPPPPPQNEVSAPPSLTCIATDICFGVSSSICLSIDSSSGDVGVSVLNVRVGFDSDGNFDGAGWDEGDNEEDEEYAEERSRGGESSSSSRGARGVLERSTASAPRSSPFPFHLLQRPESTSAAPSILHSSDPSMGKLAYIHAAACKLPIESLNLSSGLQLCLLARSTNRLSVTLVPTKGFCRS